MVNCLHFGCEGTSQSRPPRHDTRPSFTTMARSSSPLPIRHPNSLPQKPSLSRTPIYIDELDDFDELAGDTIPCSPGAVLRHDDTTQPTQVLGRTTLESSSPPPSVIEVPASSPFQQPSKRPTLGSRLAPAGTLFRPPVPRPQPNVNKRPASDLIDLVSSDDDNDDLTPPRGDIRPTTFKAHVTSFVYNAEADGKEKAQKQKIKQIYDVFGSKYTSDRVRQALKQTGNDVERAMDWLERHGPSSSSSKQAGPSKPNGRRLISKATLQAQSSTKPSPIPSSPSSSRNPTPSPPKQKQQKRRLVRGLKNPSTPSPKKSFFPPPPSSDDPLVIDLVDNDKDDAYQAERSPTPDEDSATRVLDCINKSTLQELGAMTGMKESNLEPIINQRPFNSLEQARKVAVPKKPGARKVSRVSAGETVVDAVEVFLDAVEAIDHVVAECEKKAKTVRDVMDTWDVNSFGRNKRSGQNTPEHDSPPTPTSISSSKLCRPPIPKQPIFMDGHCQMKPFQLFGLNWMSLLHTYDIGCILADEMGLGKTCQVISFISHLVESFDSRKRSDAERPWPNLIVVPPSTYNNWLAEFQKFAPELSVVGYRGSQAERMEIGYQVEQAPEEYHVVLGTYSQVNGQQDVESLNSMSLHAAIFDEGHKMKNPETKIYQDLRRIETDWKMLLTG